MRIHNSFCVLFLVLSGCSDWKIQTDCQIIDGRNDGYALGMPEVEISDDLKKEICGDEYNKSVAHQIQSEKTSSFPDECQSDKMFSKGRSGEDINISQCKASDHPNLLTAYRKGLKAYCSPQNGFSIGLSGNDVKKVCEHPEVFEFKKEFLRGRRTFFTNQITRVERLINDTDARIGEMEKRYNEYALKLAELPLPPPQTGEAVTESSSNLSSALDKKTPSSNDPYGYLRESYKKNMAEVQKQLHYYYEEKNSLLKRKVYLENELDQL